MRYPRRATPALLALAAVLAASAQRAPAQTPSLTSPETFFGHPIGADHVLPNYQRLAAYWQTLAGESDRMALVDIGRTAEDRTQYMAIVTSPENHRSLARYREISRRLALAEGLSDDEARRLAREGKAVVWIDGGLHATEVLGAQQLTETLWQMVSGTDAETLRILDDVVILFVHANPDGHDLVADWYMRVPDPERRSTAGVPRLYQKYIGHDNNRDFYASTQAESENMNRQLYHEWFPQILYNHHQTGPLGTVMFAPPFRDPFNYFFDPMVVTGIDVVGSAMHDRFAREGKPGVTRRRGANYSVWWNGGLRTTVYFHNMIGLLTETIGNPTPMEIPFVVGRVLPNEDYPYPIAPQRWHFRQSVDYSVTANKAVLDIASRNRENFLYNIYRMGRNSIERGSSDHWTDVPRRVEALRAAMGRADDGSPVTVPGGLTGQRGTAEDYATLRRPELRDPRGFILPADQADFATATKFVNALLETGVTVQRATAAFEVNGKRYPAGSYVVKTDQAFRPHVLDMFEPQDHRDDFLYPGGPPIPPYDNAGWTLAFQMGVEFDRILDGFDGPFERIEEWNTRPPAGTVATVDRAAGYLFSHRVNDAFAAVNRLQAAGETVSWLTQPFEEGDRTHEAGTFYVAARGSTAARLQEIARDLGVSFQATATRPAVEALRLRPARIALVDVYGGSMPSGWIRWILEQWEYPTVEVVFPPQLDAGDLRRRYDVIVLADGVLREGQPAWGGGGFGGGLDTASVPAEWRARMGRVTEERTAPQLRRFLEEGGTVVTIGSSTALARQLGLPVESALVERGPDGAEQALPREKYYVPGSVLRTRVQSDALVAHGVGPEVDVFFDNSPAFRLGADAGARGVRRVAWFETASPLRSGWAWGQHYLEGAASVAEADVGRGKLYLFGPEITFRAQPHGTFKLLFNAIALSNAEARRP